MSNRLITTHFLEKDHHTYSFEYLFPFPISDLFKKFQISISPVDKLGYLISTIEVALKFLAAIGLSIAKFKNKPILLTDVNFNTPTLGTWKYIVQKLLPIISEEIDEGQQLNSFMNFVQDIIINRNIFAHSSTITEDTALLFIDENEPLFIEALKNLSLFKRFLLVVPEKVDPTRNPQGFNAIVRICRGCNCNFQYDLWQTKAPLYPNIPILICLANYSAIMLHPFIRFIKNKQNGYNNFYFFSRMTGRSNIWQTFEYYRNNFSEGEQELNIEVNSFLQNGNSTESFNLYLTKIEFNTIPIFFDNNSTSIADFEMPSEYKLVGKIGEGRFSDVYKVKHKLLNEIRVLKIPRKNLMSDVKVATRFDTEAQILSKLKDTGTSVRLHEYSNSKNGIPYLVEEYAEVGTLEDFLFRVGKLTWQDMIEIGYDCFKKLKIIHDNGIIHRDIKPSNILIDANYNRLFCDFGVGKMFELGRNITSEGDSLGTQAFMAPEQQEGNSVVKSDYYSLGVCLVVLLSGSVPQSPRNWIFENNENLPRELTKLLLSLVEPILENRPANINAILQVLGVLRKRKDEQKIELSIKRSSKPIKEIKIWTSPDKTEFRFIPAGEFMMGGTKYPDERPVHKVILTRPFYMATTLVTNAQFLNFVSSTKYKSPCSNFLKHNNKESGFSSEWRNPDNPVVFVSWIDAKEYLLWRSEKDNRNYLLPTEAEWEYACRACNRFVYSWGNEFDHSLMNVADIIGHPTPVGTYSPNDWGIYDLLGNVWEWCEDFFDVRHDEESVFYKYCSENYLYGIENPVNSGKQPFISLKAKPNHRTGRGGSFFSKSHNCRPANRRGEFENNCLRSFGFRLVVRGVTESEEKIILTE